MGQSWPLEQKGYKTCKQHLLTSVPDMSVMIWRGESIGSKLEIIVVDGGCLAHAFVHFVQLVEEQVTCDCLYTDK